MRSQVKVIFSGREPVQLEVGEPLPPDQARHWLNQQFTDMECVPLRPTGKLLTADKVLCVAQAGESRFADPDWARRFAQATTAVLAKPMVTVDVPRLGITY